MNARLVLKQLEERLSVMEAATDESEGKWRTVNGRKVFLRKNREKEDLKEHIQTLDRADSVAKKKDIMDSFKHHGTVDFDVSHKFAINKEALSNLELFSDIWNNAPKHMVKNVAMLELIWNPNNVQHGSWNFIDNVLRLNLSMHHGQEFKGREKKNIYRNITNHELGHSILDSYPAEKHTEFQDVLIYEFDQPFITGYVSNAMLRGDEEGDRDRIYVDETFAEFVKLYNDPTKSSWTKVDHDAYDRVEQAVKKVFGDLEFMTSNPPLKKAATSKAVRTTSFDWDYGMKSVYWLDASGKPVKHAIMEPDQAKTAAEDGKWRTINGRKVWLPKDGEEEALKKHVKKFDKPDLTKYQQTWDEKYNITHPTFKDDIETIPKEDQEAIIREYRPVKYGLILHDLLAHSRDQLPIRSKDHSRIADLLLASKHEEFEKARVESMRKEAEENNNKKTLKLLDRLVGMRDMYNEAQEDAIKSRPIYRIMESHKEIEGILKNGFIDVENQKHGNIEEDGTNSKSFTTSNNHLFKRSDKIMMKVPAGTIPFKNMPARVGSRDKNLLAGINVKEAVAQYEVRLQGKHDIPEGTEFILGKDSGLEPELLEQLSRKYKVSRGEELDYHKDTRKASIMLSFADYKIFKTLKFEAARLIFNAIVGKGSEDEHNGEKGKWRTINGHRVWLPEGREEEAIRNHVKQFKDKPKKLPKYLQQSYKEYDYPDFEKTWQEKYAKKWDAVLKKDEAIFFALKAIPLVGRDRWGRKDGNHRRHLFDNFKDRNWVEPRLDKLNELFGTEKTIEDLFKESRNPTEEEKKAFVKRANELEDFRIEKKKKKLESVKKESPEGASWIKNLEESIERMTKDKRTWTSEDFDTMPKTALAIDELMSLERDKYGWDDHDNRLFTYDAEKKFSKKYGTFPIESTILENPMKFYDLLKDEPGSLGDVMRSQAEIEAVNRRIREQATSIWRGGTIEELDNFLEQGFIGAGRKKKESDMPAKTHGRVPVSYYEKGAAMFDFGVRFEYDKAELEGNLHPEFYNMFVNIDYSKKENIYWNDYTPNGHDPRFKMQAEAAIQRAKKIKPKKLKLHLSPHPMYWDNILGNLKHDEYEKVDRKELHKKIRKKYGHLGEIIFRKKTDDAR